MRQTNNNKPAITGLMALFFLFILSISCFATTYSDYNTKQTLFAEWREDGRTSIRDHRADFPGNFDNTYTGTQNYITVAGIPYQPIVFDYDSTTGTNPTITTHSGNFIEFYQASTNKVLTNVGEYNVGSAIASQPIGVDYNNDGEVEYIFANSSDVIVYNSSGLVNNTIHYGITTGIGCQNMTDKLIHCFFGGQDGTNNLNLTEYYPHNNTIVTHNVSSAGNFDAVAILNNLLMAPLIWDWDKDGVAEIMIACDLVVDGDVGFCVYSSQTFSLELSADNLGGGDTAARIGGMLINNLDGVGDDELCITYYEATGGGFASSEMKCFNSDGTSFGVVQINNDGGAGTGSAFVSNPVLAVINSTKQICDYSFLDTITDRNNLNCYKGTSGSLVTTYSRTSTGVSPGYWSAYGRIASNDLNADGNDEIITGSTIFYANSSSLTLIPVIYDATHSASHTAIVDIDNDGFADILSQTTNSLALLSSTATTKNLLDPDVV